jgi:ABC-2 type transport system ATP-binding protein
VLEIVEKLCSDVGIIANGKLVYQASMEDVRQNGSLEERFITAVGGEQVETQQLSWLAE